MDAKIYRRAIIAIIIIWLLAIIRQPAINAKISQLLEESTQLNKLFLWMPWLSLIFTLAEVVLGVLASIELVVDIVKIWGNMKVSIGNVLTNTREIFDVLKNEPDIFLQYLILLSTVTAGILWFIFPENDIFEPLLFIFGGISIWIKDFGKLRSTNRGEEAETS